MQQQINSDDGSSVQASGSEVLRSDEQTSEICTLPFKTVRLNGRRWSIEIVDRIEADGDECVGLCDTSNRTIFLQAGMVCKLQDTLFHEMIHASCPTLTEDQVCEVERGVYAMLADNPSVRKWLFKNA